MISAGEATKRPPHILLAGLSVTGGPSGWPLGSGITMKNDRMTPAPRQSYAVFVAVAVVSAMLGFAAVYGTLGPRDNNAGTPPTEAAKQTGGANPAASSETAPAGGTASSKLTGFVAKKSPEALPEFTFLDGAGQKKSLNDFKGKTILLNLWATWCAPCREEMPSLDRLEKELGSEKFEVIALALDRGGANAARKFLDGIKVENLKLYVDPSTRSGSALRVIGMPTTILIDREGREIGRLPGPAEWDSPDAKRLIESHLQ
jgi:thiol-disulfide isomerase/thioredoxin